MISDAAGPSPREKAKEKESGWPAQRRHFAELITLSRALGGNPEMRLIACLEVMLYSLGYSMKWMFWTIPVALCYPI